MTRNPELADATDLDAYAEQRPREAQELLPHLVRRLLANTPGVTGVSVRTGSSIGMIGYDGQADGGAGTGFVPPGPGVWELGTGGKPRKKAQDDYRNRTRDSLGVEKAATAFVEVSLRKWEESDRQNWLRLRNKERKWRQVVALDADDLDGWLDEIPAVRVWVSEQIGRRPRAVATLDLWWQRWAGATRPALPGQFLTAGRQTQAHALTDLLAGVPAAHRISGPSRDESMAFIAAALSADLPAGQRDAAPLVLIVSIAEEWGRLLDSTSPMVLIPDFPATATDVAAAVRAGHHVLLPTGWEEDPAPSGISLPRTARDEGRDALIAAGWAREDADKDAAQGRRSLQSLRRDPRYAISPAMERPTWSRRPVADTIAPLVLAGAWQATDTGGEPSTADRAIVSTIAGTDYEALERDLDGWVRGGDPPLNRSGSGWRLAAPADAWTLLHPSLSAPDIERWFVAALDVLTETDPVLNLPPAERFYAGARGIRRARSGLLRRGIAEGTALLGAAGTERVGDRRTGEDHARRIVRAVLSSANADSSGLLWKSLADVLPLLAEAAPDEFLDAVEVGLSGSPPLLMTMFEDQRASYLGSYSPHTGLLWALETLSWAPAYLSRTTDQLARLAEADPGGRLSNRPSDSLRRVFLPWNPSTAAPAARRTIVLSGLAGRRPKAAFGLLLSLLPSPGDTSHATHSPRFREWRPDSRRVSAPEYLEAITGIIDLLLPLVRQDPHRWLDLLPGLSGLPANQVARCLDALDEVTPDALPDDLQLALWNAIIALAAQHRLHPEARWAFPGSTVERLQEIADRLEPHALPERHASLFDYYPDLPGVAKLDHEAYDRALGEAQRAAVADALDAGGLDALARVAAASKLPRMVGKAAAEAHTQDLRDQVLSQLEDEGPRRELAIGWVTRTAELRGREWIIEAAGSLSDASELARTLFFLSLPNAPATWSLVDADEESVQERYWRQVSTAAVAVGDVEPLAQRLIVRGRPWSVIDLLALKCHGNPDVSWPPADLIVRSLRAAIQPDTAESPPPGSVDYDIGVLLDRLAASGTDTDTLAGLELAYFPALEHSREPRALYAKLAEDPRLFVDMVCQAFRAKNAAQAPANAAEPLEDEQVRVRAWQSMTVLGAWRRLPGTQDDGSVDETVLTSWVERARAQLSEQDRAAIGDECVGQLLSGSPPGADGIWPCEAVRNVIESAASVRLDAGLQIGRFNARGVTSRDLFDGGGQESALTAQYSDWAETTSDQWPRTGRLLRSLADTYAHDARREDEDAERMSDDA